MPIRRTAIIAAALLVMLAAGAGWSMLARGGKAPDFTLETPDGKTTIKLSQFAGKPVVLDFWAPWCGPCRLAMPEIQKVYAQYGRKGVVVLGVTEDNNTRDTVAVVRETGVKYPIVMDPDVQVGRKYGVRGYPTLFVLDRKGKVVAAELGFGGAEALKEAIEKALK